MRVKTRDATADFAQGAAGIFVRKPLDVQCLAAGIATPEPTLCHQAAPRHCTSSPR